MNYPPFGQTQFAKEEAIDFYNSNIWQDWGDKQIFEVAFFQKKLCVPFSKLHKATEAALNRKVYSHEFANPDNLAKEYFGTLPAPTLKQIIDLIPEEKRLIITKDQIDAYNAKMN